MILLGIGRLCLAKKEVSLKIAEGNLIILEQNRVGFVVADPYEESARHKSVACQNSWTFTM